MRYIFLDVDGVLNHAATKARINGYRSVDHANVETLKLLIDLFGLEFGKENIKLVLSSSWRYNQDLDGNFLADNEFRKELDRVLSEFDLRIDDETPILSAVERGKEIACYLSDKTASCEGYLVLDDVAFPDFPKYKISRHFVQTSFENQGLEFRHFDRALVAMEKPLAEDEIRILRSMASGSFLMNRKGRLQPVDLHVPSASYLTKGILHLSCTDGQFLLDRYLIDRNDMDVILKVCFHEYLTKIIDDPKTDKDTIGPLDRVGFMTFAELKYAPEAGADLLTLFGCVGDLISGKVLQHFTLLNEKWYEYLRNTYVKVVRMGDSIDFRITSEQEGDWREIITDYIRKQEEGGERLTYSISVENGR